MAEEDFDVQKIIMEAMGTGSEQQTTRLLKTPAWQTADLIEEQNDMLEQMFA